MAKEGGTHQRTLDSGFNEEEAQCLDLINSAGIRAALGKAIQEKSSRYASMTHSIYNVIAKKAQNVRFAPKCYRHLKGRHSLAESDQGWLSILQPDGELINP
jgi:hypothetical protein